MLLFDPLSCLTIVALFLLLPVVNHGPLLIGDKHKLGQPSPFPFSYKCSVRVLGHMLAAAS